ncbi:hypothetical protein ACFRI7_37285 [Streptomyces sp. NPDC056716]|uniref:hypothetical protein n=1 Tax=unclassified Streptomyces TaxID=2593676 RepID=UPI0036A090E2
MPGDALDPGEARSEIQKLSLRQNIDLVALDRGETGGEGLRAAVDLLTDALLSHLSYEERELIEPMARFGTGW